MYRAKAKREEVNERERILVVLFQRIEDEDVVDVQTERIKIHPAASKEDIQRLLQKEVDKREMLHKCREKIEEFRDESESPTDIEVESSEDIVNSTISDLQDGRINLNDAMEQIGENDA